MRYRLKTGPGEEHDKLNIGYNGLLATVKAQEVADHTGLVVVLEREQHLGSEQVGEGEWGVRHSWGWVPYEVFFPRASGTPSKRFEPC